MRQACDSSVRAGAAAQRFRQRFGRRPEVVVRAPGRANLLGAHIDYSEGWVLPAAIDRAVVVACGRRGDRRARLASLALGETAMLELDRLPPPVGERAVAAAAWSDYPAGVAWALAAAGHEPTGMDVLIAGDLAIGAGLSSSAALESALALAWTALSGEIPAAAERIRLCRRVEGGYLGLHSGIMDPFAVVEARAGHALFLDCRTLEHEALPLPPGTALVVADSGVGRRLVGSPFNIRRDECGQAVERLRGTLPGIVTLRDVAPAELELHAGLLEPPLDRRARHVVGECERARLGAAALRRGDAAELGRLMRRSHESSRDLYEVSLPELDLLAAAAWQAPGCHGARFSGGGFGGCVAALVDREAADEVGERQAAAFAARFGRRPELFTSGAAGGAELLEWSSGQAPVGC